MIALRRKTFIAAVALLAALVAAAPGCKSSASSSASAAAEDGDGDGEPAAAVRCEVLSARELEQLVEVDGVIAPPPMRDAILSSPVAGRVAQLRVEEGEAVAAGALLAVVEDPALPAGQLEAHAGVAAAVAADAAAKLDLAREARLVSEGIDAPKELDDARARAASAAAALEAAHARAGLASHQLGRRELRAPYRGVVLHVWRRVGEIVDGTAATPVLELADVSALEVRAQVAPAALVQLRVGQAATVQGPGLGDGAPAVVARVAPAVDLVTALGTVALRLRDPAAAPIGSVATARIVTGRRRGLLMPAAALRRSALGSDEVVVCRGELAEVRAVTVGSRGEGGVEISGGLAPGERVVVDAVLGLEEGRRLTSPKRASP